MQDTLILEAIPVVRQRLKYLFWLRFSSAGALIIPALAATLFVWQRSQVSYQELPNGELAVDTLSQGVHYIFWVIWVPIAVLALLAGAVCALLAYRALDALKRVVHLTPKGVSLKSLQGTRQFRWDQIRRLEVGDSLTFHHPSGRWTVREDWMGRERLEAAVVYLKERLPKEKIFPAPTTAEAILLRLNAALPYVFAALLVAIAAAALHWSMSKLRQEKSPALMRAGRPP
jgi:hypothetical protein